MLEGKENQSFMYYDSAMRLEEMHIKQIINKKVSKDYTVDDKRKELMSTVDNYNRTKFCNGQGPRI